MENNKESGLAVWQYLGIGFGSTIVLGLAGFGASSLLTGKSSSSSAVPGFISRQNEGDKL